MCVCGVCIGMVKSMGAGGCVCVCGVCIGMVKSIGAGGCVCVWCV